MDLLQTVRKEGSRGGVNFSWDDVKNSTRREAYLGHSIHAPVGRWQKGRDLHWYTRGDDEGANAPGDGSVVSEKQRAEEARREELKRIKEAEEDAMARALGLPVPDRTNANLLPLGAGGKALKDALGEGDGGESAREGGETAGVGFTRRAPSATRRSDGREVRGRDRSMEDGRRRRERGKERSGERRADRRKRSVSRSRDWDRERRHRRRSHSRSRSRSPSRSREPRRHRSRSIDRREGRHGGRQRRHHYHGHHHSHRYRSRSVSRDRDGDRRAGHSRSPERQRHSRR